MFIVMLRKTHQLSVPFRNGSLLVLHTFQRWTLKAPERSHLMSGWPSQWTTLLERSTPYLGGKLITHLLVKKEPWGFHRAGLWSILTLSNVFLMVARNTYVSMNQSINFGLKYLHSLFPFSWISLFPMGLRASCIVGGGSLPRSPFYGRSHGILRFLLQFSSLNLLIRVMSLCFMFECASLHFLFKPNCNRIFLPWENWIA